MRFSERFINHAIQLLIAQPNENSGDAAIRRAVSVAYYALFHRLNEDAVQMIAPNVSRETNYRIQRWFEHAEMKKICGRFLKEKLDQPLLGLIGESSSPDLQDMCRTFIALQEARHSSDYDPGYVLSWRQTHEHVRSAILALQTWERIKDNAEANIFILSLLMWKNWEKER